MNKLFSAALGLCALSVAASASILVPGSALQSPDPLTLTGLTMVANETVALNSLTFTANLSAAVFSGTNSVCTGANCLTFAYQVSDTGGVAAGTGIIEDLTASAFSGFTTDVGDDSLAIAASPFIAGGTAPATVDRSLSGPGAVISFDYPNTVGGASNLVPGDHTTVLIIETNAVNFTTTGLFSAIDGATATVNAYAPSAASPEPASMALIGCALIGLSFLRKRSHRKN
jgi:hypothetical protein